MPLSSSPSNAAREKNVKTEIAAGKPQKQAVAIAYAKQRENKSQDAKGLAADARALLDCLGAIQSHLTEGQ